MLKYHESDGTNVRAGEVKQIVLWFSPNTVTATGGAVNANTPGSGNYQPLAWSPITDVTLTYNGEVFNRFDAGSSQLWNIVEDQKSSIVNNLTVPTFATVSVATLAAQYVKLDFSQVYSPQGRDSMLVHGKPVLNAVVNLTFTAPAAGTLHAMYLYNASLLCSRGSSEYIF